MERPRTVVIENSVVKASTCIELIGETWSEDSSIRLDQNTFHGTTLFRIRHPGRLSLGSKELARFANVRATHCVFDQDHWVAFVQPVARSGEWTDQRIAKCGTTWLGWNDRQNVLTGRWKSFFAVRSRTVAITAHRAVAFPASAEQWAELTGRSEATVTKGDVEFAGDVSDPKLEHFRIRRIKAKDGPVEGTPGADIDQLR